MTYPKEWHFWNETPRMRTQWRIDDLKLKTMFRRKRYFPSYVGGQL